MENLERIPARASSANTLLLFSMPGRITFRLAAVLLLGLITGTAASGKPLAPLDTSSPRATMQSFLTLAGEAADRYQAFRDSPSDETQQGLLQISGKAEGLFDLSRVAPAHHDQVADSTFYLLLEIIARQRLPDIARIPDAADLQVADEKDGPSPSWRIPHTEITIARVAQGPYEGEYRFSPDTVKNALRIYQGTRELPYLRPIGIKNAHRINELFTGWMVPMVWVESLPAWANATVGGLVAWKWLAAVLLIGLELLIVIVAYRWGRKKAFDGSFRSYLSYMSAPLTFLALAPLVSYFAHQQLNVTGPMAEFLQVVTFLSYGITVVWVVWLSVNQVAEMVIDSPRIKEGSLDASLLRLIARTLGVIAIVVLIFQLLNRLGVPVAGLVTGAGVGGVAIALAAKSTLENFMGALNLFADRPVRVGDLCRYDEESAPGWRPVGRIEEIGLRSTKVRRFDRTLITIPNAEFAQRNIVNLSACDRFLLATELGLRYETTDDQMRFLLAQLRELLHAHPKTIHTVEDPIRVRFVAFGDYSLNVAIRAYIRSKNYNEFLAIQEDLLLRIMTVVEEAGSGFAFPSTTMYLGRDGGLDAERQQAAEKQVREWGSAQTLPFPDLPEDYRRRISDTLDYPPEGSPDSDRG